MAGGNFVTFKWDINPGDVFVNAPQLIREAVAKVVGETASRAFNQMKFKTPVDTGRALNAWTLTLHGRPVAKATITNDVPYINVLEYGGYPVRAAGGTAPPPGSFRRGRAWLGGFPPGPRTSRAPGGDPPMVDNVSYRPGASFHGMVRSTLRGMSAQFRFDLEEAIDRALSEAGQ